MSKVKLAVFDQDGKNITDERTWYIDVDGNLYFETSDIDMPLQDANDFTYEVRPDRSLVTI